MMRTISIDWSALSHNLQRVRHYAPAAKVLAMIKADGYGHGLLPVAAALKAADGFGVACIDEALRLRRAGFDQAILVMHGFADAEELRAFAEHDLMAVVHQPEQIRWLQQTPLTRPVAVWLKLNSGMNRLGFLPHEFGAAYGALQACRQVKRPLCLMTHLADVDNPLTTEAQWQEFDAVLKALSVTGLPCSLVNSGGLLRYPARQADWVRPGIMLYGASPFQGQAAQDYGLLPVMTIGSRVVAIQTVAAGAAIGYGSSYVCPRSMRIGVIAYGYGDGYPRHAPTGTPVLIEGQVCPMVGRVSMDLMTVDLSCAPQVTLASRVTIWGKGLPVDGVAQMSHTIPYELLCHVQKHRLTTISSDDGC